jgi:hypothetical protein
MGRHPCPKLNQAYKGYQGQNPYSAKFIFIGIDANFSPDIWNSPSPNFFEEVLEYLADGVGYWNKEKPQCPRYRHHPFLSPEYGNRPGYKYHRSFSKMLSLSNITKEYADKISFIELLSFPTCNTNTQHFIDLFNLYLFENKAHLAQIDSWINSSENIKEIFIPISVHTKICELRNQQHGSFGWLPINWLPAPPEPGRFILNTLYTPQTLTNKSINVHVITHFANAISDVHIEVIGTIIKRNSR